MMSAPEVQGDRPYFEERQFLPLRTAAQIAFDIAFGIALPLVCIYFDPIVFQGGIGGPPLVGGYFTVAAVAIGLGLLSLSVWLLLQRPPALLAGMLAGGAIFAALLGLVLLPFSVMGLPMLIGALGFTPFVTSFVFCRNAIRAYQRSRTGGHEAPAVVVAAAGLLLSCGSPWLAHWYVVRETSFATSMVLSSDPAEAARGLDVLKRFRVLATFDQLVFAYEQEENAERREWLARSYKELTGEDIRNRLALLRD